MTTVVINGARTNFGPRTTEKQVPSYEPTYGERRQLVLTYQFDQAVPETGIATPNLDALQLVIPAQSHILAAYWSTQTAFAGGTSFTLGLANAATGAAISATALFTGGATGLLLANINAAGKWVKGDGAFFSGVVGTSGAAGLLEADVSLDNNLVSADAVLTITPTGVFTAGVAKIIVEYHRL